MAWDFLSGVTEMAWDVLSGMKKTAWDVLSGVANLCEMFCPGVKIWHETSFSGMFCPTFCIKPNKTIIKDVVKALFIYIYI